jgi:tetratricopeptide (TPR) repeat protein
VNPDLVSKFRRAAGCALCAVLVFAAFWSVRMARADYDAAQGDLQRVQHACQLVPGSAPYWLRAAGIREVDESGDPAIDDGVARALAINPRFTEAWMARAVRDEASGRTDQAEQDYLAAEKVDHMYKPAWALANFYVRQNRIDRFWLYARKCLEVVEPRRLEPASYDPSPVFDLAWRVTRDAAEIRRKLIPRRHFILADYLDYLADRNLCDAGANVAIELAGDGDPRDNYALLNFCERLINVAKAGQAMDIWNAMAAHGTLHTERLNPQHGQSLTNGSMRRPFERVGFDWYLPHAEGISQNHFVDSGEIRFDFSGDQPEDALVLYQSVPVMPGAAYRLTYRYRTPDMEHADGLCWQAWDYAGQRAVPVTSHLAAQPDWAPGEALFTVPTGVSVVRLGLVYQRASGSTPIRGTAAFTAFALQERAAK